MRHSELMARSVLLLAPTLDTLVSLFYLASCVNLKALAVVDKIQLTQFVENALSRCLVPFISWKLRKRY